MLTPFDDYPIHQTPEPIAHTGSGDRNHYDRYFFNGYDRDGEWFFAVAMGLYPNRSVIDAAFSFVRGGNQHATFASGRVPLDRTDTRVGHIAVEVVEPMKTLRVKVDGEISADLTFRARTPAVEEPRFTMRRGGQLFSDYTRLSQWGAWEGWFEAGGVRTEVSPSQAWGCRDRSWGVRPVGEQAGGAPARELPQFFWLWAPLNFDGCCTHLALNHDSAGRHIYESAVIVPLKDDGEMQHMRTVEARVEWEPGTRRSRGATLVLQPWRGRPEEIGLTPLLTFQMKGIGYLHPEWSHGTWKGESASGSESYDLAAIDPLAISNLHVQQLCRADWGGRKGVGVLEQLVIGPHEPSGMEALLDGAPG